MQPNSLSSSPNRKLAVAGYIATRRTTGWLRRVIRTSSPRSAAAMSVESGASASVTLTFMGFAPWRFRPIATLGSVNPLNVGEASDEVDPGKIGGQAFDWRKV